MSGNSADGATPASAGAAKKDVLELGFHAPASDLLLLCGERKARRVLKDIAVIHASRVFNIDRTFALDAQAAITRDSQAVLQRLIEPVI